MSVDLSETAIRAWAGLLRKMWPVYTAAIERYFARHLSEAEAHKLAALMQRLSARPS